MNIKKKLLHGVSVASFSIGASLASFSIDAVAVETSEQFKKKNGYYPSLSSKKNNSETLEDLKEIKAVLSTHLKTNQDLINFSKGKDVVLLIGKSIKHKFSFLNL